MPLSRIRARCALPLAAALALLALALGFTSLPRVNASRSPGSIDISPSSGLVGTSVQVNIIPPDTATASVTYTLGTTMTDPAAGGCSSQKPIPGVGSVNVSVQGGGTTFEWPASLSQGPYWFCATPTSGSGATLYSRTPYTVTGPEAPTATPTPTPAKVVANVPAGGVVIGSTFTLTVSNWPSSDGTPPSSVDFTTRDPSQPDIASEIRADFTIAPGPGTGDYVITVKVPARLIADTYWIHIFDSAQAGSASDGRIGAFSEAFNVVGRATPAPASTDNSSSFPIILVPIVAGLVCIVVLMLTGAFLRRRARSYR